MIQDLLKDAYLVLGKDALDELKVWYAEVLNNKWDYVVFTTHRCYNLALIIEKLTQKEMEVYSAATFLTDASFFLHCEVLAEKFRINDKFPTILLCDDTLIHGRDMNHFIELIEECFIKLLPEYSETEIRRALIDSIKIYVYACSEKTLLLGRYELNFDFVKRVSDAGIHKLSGDISNLVFCIDTANISYVYSEHLTVAEYEQLNKNDFIDTSYQNTKQNAWISFVGNTEQKKAILTLRIIKKRGSVESYRVIPFVFIPNLNQQETDLLKEKIQNQIRLKNIGEEYIEYIDKWEKMCGKRTFNEWITLLCSQSILLEFNRKNGLNKTVGKQEVLKLARNYNFRDLSETEQMLKCFLENTLFTIDELDVALNEIIPMSRAMVNIDSSIASEITWIKKNMIKEKIEDYFYLQGSNEEKTAYKLSKMPYHETPERSERKVLGGGFLLRELNVGYTEKEIQYSMAYLLQMMDAGVLTFSSYCAKNIRVVGFSQFAKAGEQSLLIRPLRMYEWIPLIVRIRLNCERRCLDFRTEIQKYGKSVDCDLQEDTIESIIDFVKELEENGQNVEDWDEDYLMKKEWKTEETFENYGLPQMMQFLKLQLNHVNHYEDYINRS